MESKGGKKKSSSSSSSKSLFYEAPLGYSIEDVRPHGGIKKFRSAAYSNVSCCCLLIHVPNCYHLMCTMVHYLIACFVSAVRPQAILSPAKFPHNPLVIFSSRFRFEAVFLLLRSFSRSLTSCLLQLSWSFLSSFTVAASLLSLNSTWHCQPLQLDSKALRRGSRYRSLSLESLLTLGAWVSDLCPKINWTKF